MNNEYFAARCQWWWVSINSDNGFVLAWQQSIICTSDISLGEPASYAHGVLFWTACTHLPHVLSLPSCCEKSGKRGHSKLPKKSWTVPQCGHVTLNCVQMASKQPNVEFSSHIFQFTRPHGVAVMQGLTFRDSVVTLFKSTRWYVLSGTGFLIAHQLYSGNVMRKHKIVKSSPHQPCENTCHSNVVELSLLWMARALACF